jgi:hypothetical protein
MTDPPHAVPQTVAPAAGGYRWSRQQPSQRSYAYSRAAGPAVRLQLKALTLALGCPLALLVATLTCTTSCKAAVQPPVPLIHLAFAPGSEWTVAFNRTKDGCDLHDGVDSMPAAFHSRRDNLTYFWGAVGTELRPSAGRTLDDLRHDCSIGSIFNATLAQTPQSWANYQWLQSVHMMPNGTAFALIHNEFHAFNVSDRLSFCTTTKSNATYRLGEYCNMWSTGIGVSHDFGHSFRLVAPPPAHRVFSAPFRYERDQRVFGFGALSAMIEGDDGAFYGLVYSRSNSRTNDTQAGGMCAFRSESLGVPASYRGWAGRDAGFVSRWPDPYTSTHEDVRTPTTCLPIARKGSHPSPRKLVGLRGASPPSHMLFTDSGNGHVAYSWSWETDFARAVTRWSEPSILDLELDRHLVGKTTVWYPTILDHNSPGLGDDSYSSVSNGTAFVYAVVNRNIMRRRALLVAGPPPPLPPPAVPLGRHCQKLEVSGAGVDGVNGLFVILSNRTSDGVAIYSKPDGVHQVYRYDGIWKIAHITHKDQVWYEQTQAMPESHVPPSAKWHATREWFTPAPLPLRCAD